MQCGKLNCIICGIEDRDEGRRKKHYVSDLRYLALFNSLVPRFNSDVKGSENIFFLKIDLLYDSGNSNRGSVTD